MHELHHLLGLRNPDTGDIVPEYMARTADDFSEISVGDLYNSIELVAGATEPQPLSALATIAAVGGTRLLAMSYISLFRLRQLFLEAPGGALMGYANFTSFVDAWTGPEMPLSRSSVFAKIGDIESWRQVGCGWLIIRDLLAKTPMAGRDAKELLIDPVLSATTVDNKTGEIVPTDPESIVVDGLPLPEYLESLTAMGPGDARKSVQEHAHLPDRFVKEAVYLSYAEQLLIHCVYNDQDVDLKITGVKSQEVAQWIAGLLKVRLGK